MNRFRKRYLPVLFFSLVYCQYLPAEDVPWSNPLGGDFSASANWTGGSAPGASDTAVFDLATAGYTVTASQDHTISRLHVGTDIVTLNLGNQTLNLVADPVTGQPLRVAHAVGDSGRLSITGGTVMTTGLGVAATGGSSGLIEVDGPQARLELVGTFHENQIGGGDGDTGEVRVRNGARFLTEADVYLGRNGGTGIITVQDDGSQFSVGDFLAVGLLGHGELYVRGGGRVTVGGSLAIANQDLNPSGVVEVDIGGEISVAGNVAVGRAGNGSLTIGGGNVHSNEQIQVGSDNGGDGILTVHAGGHLDTGKLNSPSGTSGIIGRFEGTTGQVLITGPGSQWLQDGNLGVGWSGTGALAIEQGGLIESARGQLGRIETGSGNVMISGEARWTVAQDLTIGGTEVGAAGHGSLVVSSRGRATVGETLRVWSTGVIDVSDDGIIEIGNVTQQVFGRTVYVGAGGTLTGSGEVIGDVIVEAGVVSPGSSPGMLTVNGNYFHSLDGTITSQIGGITPGLEHDTLSVAGVAILAGTLNVELVDIGSGTFQPQLGQAFDLVTAGLVIGTFTNYVFPDLAANLQWDVQYLTDRVTLLVESRCDFDSNLTCDLIDLDALTLAVAGGGGPSFDLNGDGMVDQGDLSEWLDLAGLQNLGAGQSYIPGDANLDASVDGSDFGVWNSFKFTSTGRWSQGDFNANGFTDGSDFNIWNANKFTSARAAVPEPASVGIFAWGLLPLAWRLARQSATRGRHH